MKKSSITLLRHEAEAITYGNLRALIRLETRHEGLEQLYGRHVFPWRLSTDGTDSHRSLPCPLGKKGSHLLAREAYRVRACHDHLDAGDIPADCSIDFLATEELAKQQHEVSPLDGKWRSASTMPLYLSRAYVVIDDHPVAMRLRDLTVEEMKMWGLGPVDVCVPAGVTEPSPEAVHLAYMSRVALLLKVARAVREDAVVWFAPITARRGRA